MTIPEPLLNSLCALSPDVVKRNCDPMTDAAACNDPDFRLTEESFAQYWETDICGKEKLKEGMDAFTAETEKLIKILIDKF
jgi:transaldolase